MSRRQAFVFAGLFLLGAGRIASWFRFPTFFAEDGALFFRESITLGFPSLFTPTVGHIALLERSIALLSLLFPIVVVPTVYKVVAGLVSCWCFSIFSRDGYRWIVPDDRIRSALCVVIALLPATDELSFSVCTLYYPLLLAAFLILLEQNSEGVFQLSPARIALLTGLWFSTGAAILCLPLLFVLSRRPEGRGHLVAALTLIVAVVLNMTAVFHVEGKYKLQSVSMLDSLGGAGIALAENVLVRLFLLPLFGPQVATGLIRSPDVVFWPLMLVLVGIAGRLARRRKAAIVSWLGRPDHRTVLIAVGCLMLICPLSVFVRPYTIPVYLRPTLFLGLRYSFIPAFAALLLWAALLGREGVRRSPRIALPALVWISFNLAGRPFLLPPQRAPQFEREWPVQAQQIEELLAARHAGTLCHPETVGPIICFPEDWADQERTITISPRTPDSPGQSPCTRNNP